MSQLLVTNPRPYHCFTPPWLTSGVGGYKRIALTPHSRGVSTLAHRVAVTLYIADPKDIPILHRCGNPGCCNPPHLYGGSHKQNQVDAAIHDTARKILNKEAQPYSGEASAIWVPTALPLVTAQSLLPDFTGFHQCLFAPWLASIGVAEARRLSFQLFRGPLAPNEQVDSMCGEEKCINPLHLVRAAQQPDLREHDRRVRVKKPAILAMLDPALTNRDIARKYEIHEVTVGHYRRLGRDFLLSLL